MAPGRRRLIFLFVILMTAIFVPLCFAAPRVKIEPPGKEITAGRSVALTVRLEWPKTEGPYEINSFEPKLENLVLLDQNQSQETGETVTQALLYKFHAPKPGAALIYPFEVRYREAGTEPWIPIMIPEQKIKVASRLPLTIALIGLGILAGLSVAIFAGFRQWDFWKIREAARKAPMADPKQRVYAQAEEAIMNFASPDSKEKLNHWFTQLRIVVSAYYDISSRTATPAEILEFLKIKGAPAGDQNEISRLFNELTEMQFSRYDISAYDLARIQRTLLQYVSGKIIIGNPNP
jgi:hypothetical protein